MAMCPCVPQMGTSSEVGRRFSFVARRLMYGTDQTIGTKRDPEAVRTRAHDIWTRDWRFLTTDDRLRSPDLNGAFRGLKLPRAVVDKLYRTNAERWFPGIKPRG